jgi:hypothetical protein
MILTSTVALTLENPLQDPNGQLINILFYFDIVFTIIFCFEFVVKVVYFGFMFNGSNSYIRNSWNILDFIIVSFSVNKSLNF